MAGPEQPKVFTSACTPRNENESKNDPGAENLASEAIESPSLGPLTPDIQDLVSDMAHKRYHHSLPYDASPNTSNTLKEDVGLFSGPPTNLSMPDTGQRSGPDTSTAPPLNRTDALEQVAEGSTCSPDLSHPAGAPAVAPTVAQPTGENKSHLPDEQHPAAAADQETKGSPTVPASSPSFADEPHTYSPVELPAAFLDQPMQEEPNTNCNSNTPQQNVLEEEDKEEEILSPISPVLVCTQGAFHRATDEPADSCRNSADTQMSTSGEVTGVLPAVQHQQPADQSLAEPGVNAASPDSEVAGGKDVPEAATQVQLLDSSVPVPSGAAGESKWKGDMGQVSNDIVRCSTDDSGRKVIPVIFTGTPDLLATEHKQTWTPCLPVNEAMTADVETFATMPQAVGAHPVEQGYLVNPTQGKAPTHSEQVHPLHGADESRGSPSCSSQPDSSSPRKAENQASAGPIQVLGHTHECVSHVASAAAGLHAAGEPLHIAAKLAEAALHPARAVDEDSAVTSSHAWTDNTRMNEQHTVHNQLPDQKTERDGVDPQSVVAEQPKLPTAGTGGAPGVAQHEEHATKVGAPEHRPKESPLLSHGIGAGAVETKQNDKVPVRLSNVTAGQRGERSCSAGWPHLPAAEELEGGVPSAECCEAAVKIDKSRQAALRGHVQVPPAVSGGVAAHGGSSHMPEGSGQSSSVHTDEKLIATKEEVNEVAAAAGALAHLGQHIAQAAAAAEVAYHPDELVDMMCSLTNQPGSNIVPLARAIAAIEHLGGATAKGAPAGREQVFPTMHKIWGEAAGQSSGPSCVPLDSVDHAPPSSKPPAGTATAQDAELEDITSVLNSTDQASPLEADHLTATTDAGVTSFTDECTSGEATAELQAVGGQEDASHSSAAGTASGLETLVPGEVSAASEPGAQQGSGEAEDGDSQTGEVLELRKEVMELAASAAALSHLGHHVADAAAAAELARHSAEVMNVVAAVGNQVDAREVGQAMRGLVQQPWQAQEQEFQAGSEGDGAQVVHHMRDNQLATCPILNTPRITPAGMDDAGVLSLGQQIQETEMGMGPLIHAHDQVGQLAAAAAGLHLAQQPVYRAANMAEVVADPAHAVDFDSAFVSTAADDQSGGDTQQPHHLNQQDLSQLPQPSSTFPPAATDTTTAASPFADVTQQPVPHQNPSALTSTSEASQELHASFASEDMRPTVLASQVTLDQATGLPAGDVRNLGVSLADVVGAYDRDGLGSPRTPTGEHRDMLARAAAAAGGLVCIGNAVRRAADLAQVATTPADVVDATSAHTALTQQPADAAPEDARPAAQAGRSSSIELGSVGQQSAAWHARQHGADDVKMHEERLVAARDLSARAAASAAALHYIGLDIPTAALDAEVALSPAQAAEIQSESKQGSHAQPPSLQADPHHDPSCSSASSHIPWDMPEESSVWGASMRTMGGTSVRSSIRESGFDEGSSCASASDLGHSQEPTSSHQHHYPSASGASYQWSDTYSYDADLKEMPTGELRGTGAWPSTDGSPRHGCLGTRSTTSVAEEEAIHEFAATKLAEQCLEEADEDPPSPVVLRRRAPPSSSSTTSVASQHGILSQDATLEGESFQLSPGRPAGASVSSLPSEGCDNEERQDPVAAVLQGAVPTVVVLPRVRKQLDLVMHRRQFGDLSDQSIHLGLIPAGHAGAREAAEEDMQLGGSVFCSWSSETTSQWLMSPVLSTLDRGVESWDTALTQEAGSPATLTAQEGGQVGAVGAVPGASSLQAAEDKKHEAGGGHNVAMHEQVVSLIPRVAGLDAVCVLGPSPSLMAEAEPLLTAAVMDASPPSLMAETELLLSAPVTGPSPSLIARTEPALLPIPAMGPSLSLIAETEPLLAAVCAESVPSLPHPGTQTPAVVDHREACSRPPVNEALMEVGRPGMLPITPDLQDSQATDLHGAAEQPKAATIGDLVDASPVERSSDLFNAGMPAVAVAADDEVADRVSQAASAMHNPYDVYTGVNPDYYPLGGYVNYGPTNMQPLPSIDAVVEHKDPDLVPTLNALCDIVAAQALENTLQPFEMLGATPGTPAMDASFTQEAASAPVVGPSSTESFSNTALSTADPSAVCQVPESASARLVLGTDGTQGGAAAGSSTCLGAGQAPSTGLTSTGPQPDVESTQLNVSTGQILTGGSPAEQAFVSEISAGLQAVTAGAPSGHNLMAETLAMQALAAGMQADPGQLFVAGAMPTPGLMPESQSEQAVDAAAVVAAAEDLAERVLQATGTEPFSSLIHQHGLEPAADDEWHDAQDGSNPATSEEWCHKLALSLSNEAVRNNGNTDMSVDVPSSYHSMLDDTAATLISMHLLQNVQPPTHIPPTTPANKQAQGLTVSTAATQPTRADFLDNAFARPQVEGSESPMSFCSIGDGAERNAAAMVDDEDEKMMMMAESSDSVQLLADPPMIQMGVPAELMEIHDVVSEVTAAAANLVAQGEPVQAAVQVTEPRVLRDHLGLVDVDGAAGAPAGAAAAEAAGPQEPEHLSADLSSPAAEDSPTQEADQAHDQRQPEYLSADPSNPASTDLPPQPEYFSADSNDPAAEIDMSQITGHLQASQHPHDSSAAQTQDQQHADAVIQHPSTESTNCQLPGKPVPAPPPTALSGRNVEDATSPQVDKSHSENVPACAASEAELDPNLEELPPLTELQAEESRSLQTSGLQHLQAAGEGHGGLVSLTQLMNDTEEPLPLGTGTSSRSADQDRLRPGGVRLDNEGSTSISPVAADDSKEAQCQNETGVGAQAQTGSLDVPIREEGNVQGSSRVDCSDLKPLVVDCPHTLSRAEEEGLSGGRTQVLEPHFHCEGQEEEGCSIRQGSASTAERECSDRDTLGEEDESLQVELVPHGSEGCQWSAAGGMPGTPRLQAPTSSCQSETADLHQHQDLSCLPPSLASHHKYVDLNAAPSLQNWLGEETEALEGCINDV